MLFSSILTLATAVTLHVQILDAPDQNVTYQEVSPGTGGYFFTDSHAVISAEGLAAHLAQESVSIELMQEGSLLEVGSIEAPSDAPLFSWENGSAFSLMALGNGSKIQFYRGFDGSKTSGSILIASPEITLGKQEGDLQSNVILIGGSAGITIDIGSPLGWDSFPVGFAAYSSWDSVNLLEKKTGISCPQGFVTLWTPSFSGVPKGFFRLDASRQDQAGDCFIGAQGPLSISADTIEMISGKTGKAFLHTTGEKAPINLTFQTKCDLQDQGEGISSIIANRDLVYIQSNDGSEEVTASCLESPMVLQSK